MSWHSQTVPATHCVLSPSANGPGMLALPSSHLATAVLNKLCPDQFSSPQTCSCKSEFIFWMSSQMNVRVAFRWGLNLKKEKKKKKTPFQPIFPYHHRLPWRCLQGRYMVRLHIPSPHREWDCKRTLQLF